MKDNYEYKPEDFARGFADLKDNPEIYSVTVFCDAELEHRIKITRLGKQKGEYRVTTGKPAFVEREFIRLCKKAQTKPKRTWLRGYPTKRSTKKS